MLEAMERMAAVVERARYLTRDEQEALAVRIETVADGLHWEQWFLFPDRFLAESATSEASTKVVPPSV